MVKGGTFPQVRSPSLKRRNEKRMGERMRVVTVDKNGEGPGYK